ncbi:MAG: hypothetical protein GJ676_15300 [Rhodobacteraceae bacterium]|nr:hypothetical protein [Paracoccaceae bacterium]
MAQNKLAVAVIHGMGSQGGDPQDINGISFSKELYRLLSRELGAEFMGRVGWREIFWADILQERQEDFVDDNLAGKGARWMKVRRFVMHNLADAASYRRTPQDQNDQIYTLIHARVHRTIERLEQITDGQTPLLILAHSLGGHIMSNYIYDMTQGTPEQPANSDFQRFRTMAGFVTFGCNIPVFSFSYDPSDIQPIQFPGTSIPDAKRLRPWWLNMNDKDDALGMPLAGTSSGYQVLEDSGQLDDRWIDSGGALTFWNPASHNGYWTDRHFYEPVAAMMRKAMQIGPI